MAQEELQESKLTKAGGRKPTHGCNYPMVGWPSVILTPMGPSLNLTREGTSRPSLRSSLSLSGVQGQPGLSGGGRLCIGQGAGEGRGEEPTAHHEVHPGHAEGARRQRPGRGGGGALMREAQGHLAFQLVH